MIVMVYIIWFLCHFTKPTSGSSYCEETQVQSTPSFSDDGFDNFMEVLIIFWLYHAVPLYLIL